MFDRDTVEAGRSEVRAWLKLHPSPRPDELADAGYVAPGWPRPWGRGVPLPVAMAMEEEFFAHGIDVRAHNPIGIGWAGPTILAAGTDRQKERFLTPMLRGDEFWCQLFSEPGAGSDLAGLSTRAVRDGDDYVVSGQKVWNTWAGRADYGILLARTDPDAPKHAGISYFICPMRRDGIEVREIRDMAGGSHFTEVFLDEVRIPAPLRLGAEGDGWRLARLTLGNERMSLSSGGVLWGMGPTTSDLVSAIVDQGRLDDPTVRDRVARMAIEGQILEILGERIFEQLEVAGRPGPEAAIKKLIADRHGQVVTELARDLAGASAVYHDVGPLGGEPGEWPWGFLFSRALTIGGGTREVLLSLVGESVLGLPREPDPTYGRPWSETRRSERSAG